ncbi:hypothetical protein AKO1_008324 [Acrasis kona]|uniref:BRISC and BRCA1-A complex member 1 n=1 Tax=Acrasis kona TaxID=1008807 RepID=A0AAW2YNA8_9EUKA
MFICPREKIVFFLDLSDEIGEPIYTRSTPKDASDYTPSVVSKLEAVKKAMQNFISIKSSFNKKHEFALVVLTDECMSVTEGFSSNIEDILFALNDISTLGSFSSFSMDSIVNAITNLNIEHPLQVLHFDSYGFEFIVRFVVIYSRSECIPLWNDSNSINTFKNVANHGYLFLDYIQLYPSHKMNSIHLFEDAAKTLCSETSLTYGIECISTAPLLTSKMCEQMFTAEDSIYNTFSKILVHPLQRRNVISKHSQEM